MNSLRSYNVDILYIKTAIFRMLFDESISKTHVVTINKAFAGNVHRNAALTTEIEQ